MEEEKIIYKKRGAFFQEAQKFKKAHNSNRALYFTSAPLEGKEAYFLLNNISSFSFSTS